MATQPKAALRLGMEGKEAIVSGFAEIGTASETAAKRAAAAFDRAGDDITAATKRQEQAAQTLAAFSPNVNMGTEAQGPSTAAYRQYAKDMADQQRQVEALRNAIDPLRIAQAAYDNEVRIANGLAAQGAITEAERVASLERSGQALTAAKVRLGEGAEGFNKMGNAGLIADHVVRSFSDSVAAGQSPMRAATMEMGRVVEGLNLWAIGSNKTEGAIGTLATFMGGPWGLAVTLAVSALGTFIPKLFETDDTAKKAAEQGLKSFEDRQKEMARFIDATTGKLIEQQRAMANLTALQYPAAIQAKAGETQGYTNQAFATARAALVKAGHSRAGSNDVDLARAISDAGSNSDALAKNIDQLAARRPALSALANTVGDLAQKAHDSATEIRTMQGNQAMMNDGLRGAKILTGDVIDGLVAHKMATDGVTRAQVALDDVEKQRSKVEAMPYGPAQQAAWKKFGDDLLHAKQGVESAQQAERNAAAATREHTKELTAAQKAAEAYAKALGAVNGQIAKDNEARGKTIAETFTEQMKALHSQMSDEQKDRMAPGQWAAGQLVAQRDALTMANAELASISMSADKRQLYLDTVAKTLELQRQGVDLDSDEAKEILKGVVAQDELNESLRRMSAAMDEVRSFGSQFLDDLRSGKNVAADLYQEFIKLALLNPLKNLLGGTHQTTLMDALGSIGKLFGGASGFSVPSVNVAPIAGFSVGAPVMPHNAGGTEYWGGGLSWVAENGPELIRLPRGASVTPAPQTRQLLAANNNGGGDVHHWHLEGAVVTQDLMDQMNAIGDASAMRGAYGGAALARSNSVKVRRRTMR